MTEAARQLAAYVHALNRSWQPHPAQQQVLYALFGRHIPVVLVECGRKLGKTELLAYYLWRGALLRGGSWYYFAPEQKQAKEIIWANGRLQTFGPPELIQSINHSEMRITLKNGAFIKVDGSDNFEAYRGITPDGVGYDEFKDFRPEFHRAFAPNLAVRKAPLLICGTPPEPVEGDEEAKHYDDLRGELVLGESLFNYPSWMNPHLDREWLRAEKAKLIARGEWDVWAREYEAKRVFGGSNAIFPMFSDAKHVRPHAEVMDEVWRDKKKLIWQVVCDPGNATVFGVLFSAINPYTRKVYRLAEIYATAQAETSTSCIVPLIQSIREELCPGWEAMGIEWEQLYDEAATWFATEALNSFGEHFTPTRKGTRDKNEGLSLMKDQMLHGLTVISDSCSNLIKEIRGYIKKDGKIPKVNDHLVDCARYSVVFASCDLTPVDEPAPKDPDEQRRFSTPERDMADMQSDDFELEDF